MQFVYIKFRVVLCKVDEVHSILVQAPGKIILSLKIKGNMIEMFLSLSAFK